MASYPTLRLGPRKEFHLSQKDLCHEKRKVDLGGDNNLQAAWREVCYILLLISNDSDCGADTGGDGLFNVPPLLKQGVKMIKVNEKKRREVVFKLDPDEGCITWDSKKYGLSECRSGRLQLIACS